MSLTTWGGMLAGEPAPTGPARRGAKPPVFPVTTTDDPALPEVPAARADEMDAGTVNRELSRLWRLDVALQEKPFCKTLHESAVRADEVPASAGQPPRPTLGL
ncbi:hypothetical protein [Streptomyces toyocaensis]|nr:hypothetical protein [Streptomyces toyocaensis]